VRTKGRKGHECIVHLGDQHFVAVNLDGCQLSARNFVRRAKPPPSQLPLPFRFDCNDRPGSLQIG
jgi:hypothetical protein